MGGPVEARSWRDPKTTWAERHNWWFSNLGWNSNQVTKGSITIVWLITHSLKSGQKLHRIDWKQAQKHLRKRNSSCQTKWTATWNKWKSRQERVRSEKGREVNQREIRTAIQSVRHINWENLSIRTRQWWPENEEVLVIGDRATD